MINKGVIYLTAFVLSGICGETIAANLPKGDSHLNSKIERESATGRSLRGYYTAGAATTHFADTVNYSTAAITADIERTGEPAVVQNGRGHKLYGLSASSYYKLSPAATVWGFAAYHDGTKLDVVNCDVVDYETLAPFVIGDDTGGNLRRRKYDFGGGWGRTYNDWAIGLSATYRAEIAHRQTDPRVRNIVSDLNVNIGGARRLGQSYLLGLNCGFRAYHQDTDVDFYNPVTHAITVVYTGLGSTSGRFRGADAQTASNRLTGFSASLQLVPAIHSDSFYAAVEGDVGSADLILNGYNNLNFGTVATKTVSARISRLFTTGQISLFPTLVGGFTDRVATENLFGSTADNYEKIGERKNYHHKRYFGNVSLPVSWHINGQRVLLSGDIHLVYLNDTESLVDPDRSLTTDQLTGGIALGATKRIGNRWAVGLGIGYESRNILSTSARWGALDLSSAEGAMAHHNYEMASCGADTRKGHITVSHAVKSMVIALSFQYVRLNYKDITDGNRFEGGLSITF